MEFFIWLAGCFIIVMLGVWLASGPVGCFAACLFELLFACVLGLLAGEPLGWLVDCVCVVVGLYAVFLNGWQVGCLGEAEVAGC